MTPPVRPEWHEPQYAMLATALADAKRQATAMGVEHVVCLRVSNNVLGFEVMMLTSFNAVIAAGHGRDLAVVANCAPNGDRALDPALNPEPLLV